MTFCFSFVDFLERKRKTLISSFCTPLLPAGDWARNLDILNQTSHLSVQGTTPIQSSYTSWGWLSISLGFRSKPVGWLLRHWPDSDLMLSLWGDHFLWFTSFWSPSPSVTSLSKVLSCLRAIVQLSHCLKVPFFLLRLIPALTVFSLKLFSLISLFFPRKFQASH